MSNIISQNELESYLWGSAVLLRNHIDAGAYKQYIFPLLFFKRLNDVYEEETEKAVQEFGEEAANWEEVHSFVIPDGASWTDVRNTAENVGKAIVSAFRAIEKANVDKLQGIFGDGTWTNKNRLPDRLLKDLIEHFSTKTLSIKNCPEDELGRGYEYLIKQFANDSGHTAQEFYTNRTVVHLMTEILCPSSGESIYDPTCGSAGMLISAVAYLKRHNAEWRNVSLYGQEINSLTSAIGRMNLFLHGIEDFQIVNGDTLSAPAFVERGELKTFNVVVANPPYSISQWDRDAFSADKYGRNFLGVPNQSRADFAFIQHILMSMDKRNGRCAILLPHGVLNRMEDQGMRQGMVRADYVECIIGLGKNLFYNSPMEACILICRSTKNGSRTGRVLFVDARQFVTKSSKETFLTEEQIQKIASVYKDFVSIPELSYVATNDEIKDNNFSLAINMYVKHESEQEDLTSARSLAKQWMALSKDIHMRVDELTALVTKGAK